MSGPAPRFDPAETLPLHSLAMRRWFLVLMLAVLPAQFTWAAVSEHLGHALAAVGHIEHAHHGHHNHPSHAHPASHDPDEGDAGHSLVPEASDAADASSHIGCDHCHSHCVGLLEIRSPVRALPLGAATPASLEACWAEPAPAKPERPQWVRLA